MVLTHERYLERLEERIGSIASIFVDEVTPECSASVVAEHERRHGDGLDTLLVAYFSPSHPEHLVAVREIDELRLRLFEESFEAPISAWCQRHAVRCSGEKPSLRLSQLAWMDIPGGDPGHTKAGAPRNDLLRSRIRANARATASAAYLYAKQGSLCECYHSLGWGATLQDAKLIAESLLVMGTRYLVPHAFFYSTRGLRKHDAPPSFIHMPYWPLFGELSKRVETIASAFEGTWNDAAIGVVEPSGGLPDQAQLGCYEELQHRLLSAHLDFLTVDTDILLGGTLTRDGLVARDVCLRAVVVPPMRDLEPELESWLERFSSGGGLVVQVRDLGSIGASVETLRAHCPPPLEMSASNGDGGAVLAVCRRDARRRCWLLVNSSSHPVDLVLGPPPGEQLRVVPLGPEPPPSPRAPPRPRGIPEPRGIRRASRVASRRLREHALGAPGTVSVSCAGHRRTPPSRQEGAPEHGDRLGRPVVVAPSIAQPAPARALAHVAPRAGQREGGRDARADPEPAERKRPAILATHHRQLRSLAHARAERAARGLRDPVQLRDRCTAALGDGARRDRRRLAHPLRRPWALWT